MELPFPRGTHEKRQNPDQGAHRQYRQHYDQAIPRFFLPFSVFYQHECLPKVLCEQ
jgi:hypothetical protein